MASSSGSAISIVAPDKPRGATTPTSLSPPRATEGGEGGCEGGSDQPPSELVAPFCNTNTVPFYKLSIHFDISEGGEGGYLVC